MKSSLKKLEELYLGKSLNKLYGLHEQVALFRVYKILHFKQMLMSVEQFAQLGSKHLEQVLLIIEKPRLLLHDLAH